MDTYSKILVTDTLIERLSGINSPFTGELYGIQINDQLIIIGFIIKNENTLLTKNHLPSPIDIYGNIKCHDTQDNLHDASQDISSDGKCLIFMYDYKSTKLEAYNSSLKIVQYDVIPFKQVTRDFIHFRVQGALHIVCEENFESYYECIDGVEKRMKAGQVVFQITKCGKYVSKRTTNSESINTYLVLNNSDDVIDLKIFLQLTTRKPDTIDDTEEEQVPGPILQCTQENFVSMSGNIPIDALSLVNKNSGINELYEALVESICRILRLTKYSYDDKHSISKPYHFLATTIGHFITILYPINIPDSNLVQIRKCLHLDLALPCDKPLFRKYNAHEFHKERDKEKDEKLLVNVHIGLPSPGLHGEQWTVSGNYSYYHYMQGKINDNGWGCAYRSLQTLFSWFKWYGWTNQDVPTHKEIQQVLVNIGDKPESFVGSKRWIGSLEVSFVLDTLLSVTCRTLPIPKGESISMYAREIANHFKTHSTPIMIGGGVLAHTILGVWIDEVTDETQFLVLDPHYTGTDEISTIQNKGWVGWKKPDFWKKDNFYNLCMPFKRSAI